MWIRRASRGRLFRPLSWREVRGVEGLRGAGCEGGAEGCDWVCVCVCVWVAGAVGGEVAPFVRGMSPFVSAIVDGFLGMPS